MPSCPRCDVFRAGEMGVYHSCNRCVRRAFLCGVDPMTRENCEHRRDWIIGFEQKLARHFTVEVCFHTEMINQLLRGYPHRGGCCELEVQDSNGHVTCQRNVRLA